MQFVAKDGKKLNLETWEKVENPLAVVQIVHGMAEYAARYSPMAQKLNENGYIVFADDHRGHGQTDSQTLGYSSGDMFNDTVEDEKEVAEFIQKKYPNLPHIIFAHSYGSFISQKFISLYPQLIDGIILCGSNQQKGASVLFGNMIANIGCFFKGETAKGELIKNLSFGVYKKQFDDREWISNDKENNKAYEEDDFCGFTCSYGFYRSFFKGLKTLYTEEYAEKLDKNLPMLLIAGEKDPVGEQGKGVTKLYDYYRSVGVKNISMHLIESARHECMNEKSSQKEFFEEIIHFIKGISKR